MATGQVAIGTMNLHSGYTIERGYTLVDAAKVEVSVDLARGLVTTNTAFRVKDQKGVEMEQQAGAILQMTQSGKLAVLRSDYKVIGDSHDTLRSETYFESQKDGKPGSNSGPQPEIRNIKIFIWLLKNLLSVVLKRRECYLMPLRKYANQAIKCMMCIPHSPFTVWTR